jgi:hypothetical protein
MSRNIVSISFSILFLVYLMAPTIITLIDDSADISVFYASSEDEEKGTDKNKEIEVLFLEIENPQFNVTLLKSENNLGYCFKNYPKPHLNLISPPPELHIL